MGRQVNFYMHPDDLAEFEADLRSRWAVRFVPGKLSSAQLVFLDTAKSGLHECRDRDDLHVYICRTEHAEFVRADHRPTLGYWAVDVYASPVLEFSRSSFDGRVLKRGRLYFIPEGKPREFVRWADAVIRRTRRRYVREGFYVAPHAAKWRAECGGEFRQL
jgi:hypothetical protein